MVLMSVAGKDIQPFFFGKSRQLPAYIVKQKICAGSLCQKSAVAKIGDFHGFLHVEVHCFEVCAKSFAKEDHLVRFAIPDTGP